MFKSSFIPRNSVIREKRSKDKGTDSRQFIRLSLS